MIHCCHARERKSGIYVAHVVVCIVYYDGNLAYQSRKVRIITYASTIVVLTVVLCALEIAGHSVRQNIREVNYKILPTGK